MTFQNDDTNPLVIGATMTRSVLYPNVSQGTTCGTPLDSTQHQRQRSQCHGSQ